jgi:hypothetical protein
MTAFTTRIYDMRTGVEFLLPWQTEEHYRTARAFLDKLTGGPAVGDTPAMDTYLIEKQSQRDALSDFQRELYPNGRPDCSND